MTGISVLIPPSVVHPLEIPVGDREFFRKLLLNASRSSRLHHGDCMASPRFSSSTIEYDLVDLGFTQAIS